MIAVNTFRSMALQLEGVEELPHFERTSFRIRKKIFATLDLSTGHATLRLKEVDQSVFSQYQPTNVYPVPNKWGKLGWTIFELNKLPKGMVRDALAEAYKYRMDSNR